MTNTYNQDLKKSSYLYVAFTALLLSSGSYGSDLSLREEGSHLTKERLNLPSHGESIAEELEKKPRYVFEGVRIIEDQVQTDIKQPPQEKRALKKQVKQAAKNAAARAAQERAYNMLGNKEEAEAITSTILKGKRVKGEKDKGYYLVQNSAMQAAKQAAYEAAFKITSDEERSGKIVARLKLDRYAKKANKNGGKAIQPSVDHPKVMTLKDLETEKKVAKIKTTVLSHLDKAKLGMEFGSKGTDLALKIIDLLFKFKIIG